MLKKENFLWVVKFEVKFNFLLYVILNFINFFFMNNNYTLGIRHN